MGKLYKYGTEQFGTSDNSIHLLRNEFNFKSIDFNSIVSIKIQNGKELKNWILGCIFGFVLIIYAIIDITHMFFLVTNSPISPILNKRLLVPLLPCALGIYSLIISIRVTKVMIIKCRAKSYYFSLYELIKSNEYDEFKKAIKETYPSTEILN